MTEKCFKFAVVRDPVDRFVSAFNGLKGSARYSDDYSEFVRRQIDLFLSAEDFGQWMASSPLNTRKVVSWLHFWPHYKRVSVQKVELDEILYFETLPYDWPRFAERHSLPRDLPLIGKRVSGSAQISDFLKSSLYYIYRKDFDLFKYGGTT
ncbi:hypothetical protein C84B14_03676 [Salinisphaera sp. C84B14]